MTKLCSVCHAENRDDAQFCRSCGTAFPPSAAPATSADDAQLAAGIVCDECGFQNKPGVRYCANCGVSLLGTVIVPRSRSGLPGDPYAQPTSPPPISYPSFAPVAPYPAPPATAPMYPPVGSTSFA
ncbi:MAG TPA: zinc-ribbon domain-containing protein, partial [Caldimonas sp.]|nr:zinc-ribbon domain-containing protein [Caldimonas sp.]